MDDKSGTKVESTSPTTDEIVSWWGLVIEGYAATHTRLMGEIEERYGLPPAQFDILVRLLRTPGQRMPMTKLAKQAALSSGGFTKVADRMAKNDLIKREHCDDDRRVVWAVLTDKGHKIAAESRDGCAEILRRRVLGPLGEDGANSLAEVMRVLRETNTEDDVISKS